MKPKIPELRDVAKEHAERYATEIAEAKTLPFKEWLEAAHKKTDHGDYLYVIPEADVQERIKTLTIPQLQECWKSARFEVWMHAQNQLLEILDQLLPKT